MNVTASTLPRRSASDRREPASVVSVNSGAGPTTGSRAFSLVACAHADRENDSSTAKKVAPRRSLLGILALHLLLELIEEAPVGAGREQLLRRRLDHARLVHAQRVIANRVGGVEFAPPVVRNLTKGLRGVLVMLYVASILEEANNALRLERAQIGRLQE